MWFSKKRTGGVRVNPSLHKSAPTQCREMMELEKSLFCSYRYNTRFRQGLSMLPKPLHEQFLGNRMFSPKIAHRLLINYKETKMKNSVNPPKLSNWTFIINQGIKCTIHHYWDRLRWDYQKSDDSSYAALWTVTVTWIRQWGNDESAELWDMLQNIALDLTKHQRHPRLL